MRFARPASHEIIVTMAIVEKCKTLRPPMFKNDPPGVPSGPAGPEPTPCLQMIQRRIHSPRKELLTLLRALASKRKQRSSASHVLFNIARQRGPLGSDTAIWPCLTASNHEISQYSSCDGIFPSVHLCTRDNNKHGAHTGSFLTIKLVRLHSYQDLTSGSRARHV